MSPPDSSTFCHVWPGEVIVVTYRSDREEAIAHLQIHSIKFTDVALVNSCDAKAEVIKERGIDVYIDDHPQSVGLGWVSD